MEEMNKKIIQADLKLEELKDKAREWDILAKENLELRKKIERLNNIVNKATIFLKNIGYDEEMGRIWNDMNDDECTDLLKILKGSDK